MTLQRRPTENGLLVTRALTCLGHFFHVSALFTSTSPRTPPPPPPPTSPCALQLPAFRCQSAFRRRFDYLTVHERNQPSAWSHPSSIHTSSHPQARTPPPPIPQTAIVASVFLALSRRSAGLHRNHTIPQSWPSLLSLPVSTSPLCFSTARLADTPYSPHFQAHWSP